MRPANSNLVLNACRAAATEIRAAAMQQGLELDDEDRRGLFALAAIIERKTAVRAMARDVIDKTVTSMIDILDALDAPSEDMEPCLGAPERHPTPTYGYGCRYDAWTDQTFWALSGDTDEREVDDVDLEEDDPAGGAVDDSGEHSLGAPENHDEAPDQEHWAGGAPGDYEEDQDGPGVEDAFYGRKRREAREGVANDTKQQLAALLRRKRGPAPANELSDAVMVWSW